MLTTPTSAVMRYHSWFWLVIFITSLFNWGLEYLIWQKKEALLYLGLHFISEAGAFLLTGAVLLWSQQQIQRQHFSIKHCVLGALAATLIYIPLDNLLWLVPMKDQNFDLRFLLSSLDSSTLAFFIWGALYLAYVLHQQRNFRLQESSRLSQKIQQLELQALRHQLNPHFTLTP